MATTVTVVLVTTAVRLEAMLFVNVLMLVVSLAVVDVPVVRAGATVPIESPSWMCQWQ